MADEISKEIKVSLKLDDSDFVSKLKKDAGEADKFVETVTGGYDSLTARQQEMASRFAANFSGVGKAADVMRNSFANYMELASMATAEKNRAFQPVAAMTAEESASVFEKSGPTFYEQQLDAIKAGNEAYSRMLQDVATANASHTGGAAAPASMLQQGLKVAEAEKFANALDGVAKAFDKCKEAAAGFARLTPFPALAKSIASLQKPLKDFGRAFKRILLYKTIRGGIGAIIRGWKEGFQNLYQYSIRFGTQFHETMDSLATDMQYLHNGMAAMVAPLVNAIAPAIRAITGHIVDLANAIGYFFAKILGQSSFSAAIRGEKAFNKLGGAAKDAKKQLMGFDELNVLTVPNSGGAGGEDYGRMFEEWSTALEEGSIEDRIRQAIEAGDWEGLGAALAEKMNLVVDAFGESEFGARIGEKMQKALLIANGFVSNFDFENAGTAIANNFNATISRISWKKVGDTLAKGVTGAFDFVIGFVKTFDWGKFATAFSEVIIGWFDHISEWLREVDWVDFGKTFFDKIYEFVTGIDFAGIATSFFTALGESLVGLFGVIEGFLGEMWVKWNEYCGVEADDSGIELIGKFLLGIWNGMVGIVTWVYDNVVSPFFNALRGQSGFGVDGTGGETEDAGKDVIGAFLHGLTLKWEDVKKWVLEKVEWFKNKLKGIKDWLTDGWNGGDYKWTPSQENNSLLFRAEGGTVPTGQLFIANEAGPELVGSVGGKTTVTSQDQFTAGMADIMDVTNTVILQAAQALMQTIQNKDMTAVAVIGDRQIVSAYDRGKTLAGGALVK